MFCQREWSQLSARVGAGDAKQDIICIRVIGSDLKPFRVIEAIAEIYILLEPNGISCRDVLRDRCIAIGLPIGLHSQFESLLSRSELNQEFMAEQRVIYAAIKDSLSYLFNQLELYYSFRAFTASATQVNKTLYRQNRALGVRVGNSGNGCPPIDIPI